MITRSNPCGCRKAKFGEYTPDQCPRCWRFLNPKGERVVSAPTRPAKVPTAVEFGAGGCCGGEAPTFVPLDSTPKKSKYRLKWSYGVTTVPSRRGDLLPRTLASLGEGGFDRPRLFVDGERDGRGWVNDFNLEVTCHYPNLRTFGNWVTTLWELYIREPLADRYAIFQDDFVTYRNLRGYLEAVSYPERGYLNLYTFPSNQGIVPAVGQTGRRYVGWYESNQNGRGAVALVFSREAVTTLLQTEHMVLRPQHADRGHKSVDGAVVTALKKAGWKEYVHNPSLVQHTGEVSSMGNKKHPLAESFRGEGFDAMGLLEEAKGN